MKKEIYSRYIYIEMRLTPDQGHGEASFSTKTYIEQQRREQWGHYKNPPPPPQT